MTLRDRDWAFWVQAIGLSLIWAFSLGTVAWFGWRSFDLRAHGDVWQTGFVLGGAVGGIFIGYASILTYLFVRLGAHSTEPAPHLPIDEIEEKLTHGVLTKWSMGTRLFFLLLAGLTGWALYCWWLQLSQGLSITGLARPVFWGLYITNFVFFIGMSYGGTLVSAILRVTGGEWRRAITRAAEAVAVLVLFIGAWNIMLDMGRPDRAYKVFVWGRVQSPLLWDVVAITLYIISCVLYLYLPLIPDLALLQHRVQGWRRPIYHLLAFGWTGSETQHHALERAISIVAVMVIPSAVSVHSVVAWVFAMTVQPLWHSTIFGPYFVLGAMFSGTAALIVVMAILRRFMRLEQYIRPVHFSHLGGLLLALSALWFYFTASEYLTVYYGDEPHEMMVFASKVAGPYAPLFWTMVVCCFVIPMAVLVRKRTRTVTGTVFASIAIVCGMWIERYTIVVPTLVQPRLPFPVAEYHATWIEISMMVGGFSAFAMLYMLFAKLFPVVSLWEMREGREDAADNAAERIRGYFSPPAEAAPGDKEVIG